MNNEQLFTKIPVAHFFICGLSVLHYGSIMCQRTLHDTGELLHGAMLDP